MIDCRRSKIDSIVFDGGATGAARLSRRRRTQAGQSLLIALAVLLILSFLGALFIAIVGRGLNSARQSNATSSADTYAQAGIDFADKMLRTSADGADWRPPLQYQWSLYSTNTNTKALGAPDASDPDYQYLVNGFTRYNVGNGRFLLRLSYLNETNATTQNPIPSTNASHVFGETTDSKFIKIESVGLEGTVNPDDPTTYVQVAHGRRSERIAYKPISLGDYSLFITNVDNRTDVAGIGFPSVASTTSSGTTITTPGVVGLFGTNSGNTVNVTYNQPVSVPMTFGSLNTYHQGSASNSAPIAGQSLGGGAIRANCDLRIYGLVNDYINPAYGEAIETSGRLLLDGYNQNLQRNQQASQLNVYRPDLSVAGQVDNTLVYPTTALANGGSASASGTPLFSTYFGAVRDGQANSDSGIGACTISCQNSEQPCSTANQCDSSVGSTGAGYPRNITRRNPPLIDTVDTNTHLTRYQALTQAGTHGQLGSTQTPGLGSGASSSPYGYSGPYKASGTASTIYIDNASDIQTESEQFTMRDQWINKADPQMMGYWRGPLYTPPGAVVTFGVVPGTDNLYGVTITRPVTGLSNTPRCGWSYTDGTTDYQSAIRMRFVYAAQALSGANQSSPQYVGDPNDPIYYLNADYVPGNPAAPGGSAPANGNGANSTNPNNDIIIYAEGNIRVRGIISAPGGNTDHHITLVTNGTAYIEGSILKGRYVDGAGKSQSNYDATQTTSYTSSSSIAILARQYVCVNTTQFTPGYEESQVNNIQANTPPTLTDEGYEFSSGESLNMGVLYPKLYCDTTVTNGVTPGATRVLMSSSGEDAAAYGNVYISDQTGQNYYQFFPDYTNGGDTLSLSPSPANAVLDTVTKLPSVDPADNGVAYGLGIGANNTPVANAALQPFILNFAMNQARSASNWIVRRAAVVPGDIRIEAMLYAQDNSFFVIPGDWFNTDSTDSLTNIVNRDATKIDMEFPTYGQPIDLKITIYGSVSENLPANIADQQAWLQKWGWIPEYYGADFTTQSPHWPDPQAASPTGATGGTQFGNIQTYVSPGLAFVYDPLEGFPVTGVGQATGGNPSQPYLRTDRFGRPLPFAPNLPVGPDLIYSGAQALTDIG